MLSTCALALAVLLGGLAYGADATGVWSGAIEMKDPAGNQRAEPGYLVLRQDGDALTGTAGPNASEQVRIRNGRVDGQQVSFELPGAGGTGIMTFLLVLNVDELKGTVKIGTTGQASSATFKRGKNSN
jgi:hypothetical protein